MDGNQFKKSKLDGGIELHFRNSVSKIKKNQTQK